MDIRANECQRPTHHGIRVSAYADLGNAYEFNSGECFLTPPAIRRDKDVVLFAIVMEKR